MVGDPSKKALQAEKELHGVCRRRGVCLMPSVDAGEEREKLSHSGFVPGQNG